MKLEFDVEPDRPEGMYAHPRVEWINVKNNASIFTQMFFGKLTPEMIAGMEEGELAKFMSGCINNGAIMGLHLETFLKILQDQWAVAVSGSGYIDL
jgi:hypothetical protein